MRIIILEDNEDRVVAMRSVLTDRFGKLAVEFFRSVPALSACLEASGLFDVALIGLDHDLDFIPEKDGSLADPGSGVDAAAWLATQPALAPVVVHTTNSSGGDRMTETLTAAGWTCRRVVPYGGETWIRQQWMPMVRDAIVAHAPRRSMAETGLQIIKCRWRLGHGVNRIVEECVRAGRSEVADSHDSREISIQVLYLDSRDRLALLGPDNGLFEAVHASALNAEFQAARLEAGPTPIDKLQISPEFRAELERRRVRELQVIVLRIPSPQPAQGLLICASLGHSISLDTHRTQATLTELSSVLEIAFAGQMRMAATSESVLTRRKKKA